MASQEAPASGHQEVTVVIPTFRRPQMVARAIRSVLNQTYPHVRAAVFDNASGDETAAVVAQIARADPRVSYYVHAENVGAAANFNYATSHIETPLFVILSDDDLLMPGFCEEAVRMLSEHPSAWFHCSRTVVYNELVNGIRRPNQSWKAGYYEPGAASAEHMLRDHFISTGVMFRRGVLETVGRFADYPLDREYAAVAAALHPFTVSESEHAVLVVHRSSFTAGDPTQRSDQTRIVGVVWARECLLSCLSQLVNLPQFNDLEKRNLFATAMSLGRFDTLYHLGFKAIPHGRFEEIDEVLAIAPWLGFGFLARTALRLLRLAGHVPVVRSLLVFAARFMVNILTRAKHEPFAVPRNREIVEYVRAGAPRSA
jgi:glycosyltransferase involved in cell wall biosynthesis